MYVRGHERLCGMDRGGGGGSVLICSRPQRAKLLVKYAWKEPVWPQLSVCALCNLITSLFLDQYMQIYE